MKKGLNVISLFDGMGCLAIALKELGIKVEKYYSSEIDKYAIKQTQLNFPDTVQLGSVKNVKINQKKIYLSEVYDYICQKYFNNDIHSLQGIVSEWEMLHRIDEEQTLAAYFGTQIQDENSKVSENTSLSINDRVWFFRNKMGDSERIYDIARSGERRNITNKIDVGELCKHSFWWNGDGQSESGTKEKSFSRVDWEGCNGKNTGEDSKSCNKTIFNHRIEGTKQDQNIGTISEPRKKNEPYNCNVEVGQERNGGEKETYRGIEKNQKIYNSEKHLYSINENDGISKDNRVLLSVYNETQVTVVECEWGILVFKGCFELCSGGSPCQSFSFAGKRKGMSTKCEIQITKLNQYIELKEQCFEFDGQSYLFWEYMRILTGMLEYNPEIKFLLENVEMGSKWERILSEAIGVFGVHINSALVSAQNRKRIYWTNIRTKKVGLFDEVYTDIPQPKDEGILLKDILEDEVDEKYYLSESVYNRLVNIGKKETDINDKSKCITGAGGHGQGNNSDMNFFCVAMRGREDAVLSPKRTEYGKQIRKDYESGKIIEQRKNIHQLEPRTDGKTNTLTSVQKDNLVAIGCDFRTDEGLRFREGGKSGTLAARARNDESCGQLVMEKSPCLHGFEHGTNGQFNRSTGMIRRLTEKECARLQTIPDWYKWGVSTTQIYKMLGNGWTIEVIKHILSFL